jgi:DNA-directed RNA polymerase subunit RPC12/RpoP
MKCPDCSREFKEPAEWAYNDIWKLADIAYNRATFGCACGVIPQEKVVPLDLVENTEYTSDPICPYCGMAYYSAWEVDFDVCLDGDFNVTCGNCDKDFHVERYVDVTYTTSEINKKVP